MKRTRKLLTEAADLLACCASQGDVWRWFVRPMTTPGKWGKLAVAVASSALDDVGVLSFPDLDWRECYAEAEARLRAESAQDVGSPEAGEPCLT